MFALALAMYLASGPALRAARAGAAVAGPNLGEAATAADSCLAELYTTPFDAFRHVRRCIQAWTEYDPNTCEPITVGFYSIPMQPKHGTISTAVLGPYPLINGDCPDNTYMFKFAFYNWTDDRENYDCADAPRACDRFTVAWSTPDHCCDMDFPMRANLAPRIAGAKDLWWFGGEPSPGTAYPTAIALTAQPLGYAYTWSITAGRRNVRIANPTANPAQLESTQMSPADGGMDNIQVKVTGRFGGPSNPVRLTVRAPYRAVPLAIPADDPQPGIRQTDWWYVSHLPYELDDQFGRKLPAVLPVREHFTENQVEQCWTENGRRLCSNWNRSDEGPGDLGRAQPGQITDVIRGQPSLTFETLAVPQPFPQCPANNCIGSHPGASTLKVQCFTGEVWVGSTRPAGIKVMELTWQRYRDHGRHCNIVSPTDGTAAPKEPCTCP